MSRARVLGAIRGALGRDAPVPTEEAARLEARLTNPRPNLIPARGKTAAEDRAGQFAAEAGRQQATVAFVQSATDVPGAIADYLAEQNLPTRIAMAPDPWLQTLPWDERSLLEIRHGAAREEDEVSVTPCYAAVAETGTLMLTSSENTPTSLHFLPENHIVVVRKTDIVANYEEGVARLRADAGGSLAGGRAPRTINFVTGPSRTGDIALTIIMGAHGPRRLHIVVVEDE